jgi:formylglycine-generating enzyme required for sulfatase activity
LIPRRWAVAVLALATTSCATILGNDYEIVEKDASVNAAGSDVTMIDEDAAKSQDTGISKGTGGARGGDAASDAPSDGPVCAPGQFQCREAALEVCNDDRSGWNASATCVSAALCDATSGKCLTPVCEPGDHKCDGADLQICDTGQSGWKFVSTCAGGPQFCDAGQGMCVTTACTKGDYQCAGKDLQVCTGDATGWMTTDTCASSTLCDATNKKCNAAVCTAGQHQCMGANLQVCNGSLTGWDPVSTCANASLCDQAKGQCIAPSCQPGDHRCDPNAPANLQVCNANQSGWDPAQTCVSAAYCNASKGMCDAAPCSVGQYQCSGVQLQQCKADQTGWQVAATCATSALCDAVGMTCKTPVCAPTDHTCAGAVLYNCNSGRTGLEPGATCNGPAPLCDAANGRCNVCDPSKYLCMGADLYQCAANGQSSTKIATCSSALACNPTLGACSQCPATGRGPTMVNVGGFCIDGTEVTNAQYKAFTDTNPAASSYPHPRCTFNTTDGFLPHTVSGGDNYPVSNVDWCDAYAFCKWAGKRLCGQIGGTSIPTTSFDDVTQDQWYQACTSNNPTANLFPYGATYQDQTCNGYAYLSAGKINVGQAAGCHPAATPYSAVMDLSGNVDEWEDSCNLITSGSMTQADGRRDSCRSRGGSYGDGGDPVGSGGDTPFFLECAADWGGATATTGTDYQARSHYSHFLGFRCCAP